MVAVNMSFIGGAGWQFFDNNGKPLSGGKIYTYSAGTTTPVATYTSRSGTVPNTNPIILDAAGRTPQEIWAIEGTLYKYVVKTSADVLIRTWDNVGGSYVPSDFAQDLASTTDNAKGDALVGFRQSNASGFLTGSVGNTVNYKLQEIVSVRDFGAAGDGVTDDTAAVHAAITAAIANSVALFFPAGNYRVTSGYTNSQPNKSLVIRGESYTGFTTITLDSASSSRFFYDYTGGGLHSLTVENINFACAQSVIDTDFFRFSNVYSGTYKFTSVQFSSVNRPIVFKANTYQDNCVFIKVYFSNSGTIYSDSNVGSRGNIMTLIDVAHGGSTPENTAKQVMNLQGFRGIQATNLLLQGSLPSSGWTILYLDNEYSADWTQDNVLQADGFWSEWPTNPPTYIVDQKGGRTLWNSPTFGDYITNSGTQNIIRLREKAQMQINNSSFIGEGGSTLESMFSFENTNCHVVFNRCMTRYLTSKNNVNMTFVNCSLANDGSVYYEPVTSALFGTQQSAVAFRWAGGYVGTYGGTLTLGGGATATPSTDTIYGRKYVITPSGNSMLAQFNISTRGFIQEGTQYNIILACKMPAFTGGYFLITPAENNVEVGGAVRSYVSGEFLTVNISRRLGAGITAFGPRFISYATGVSGNFEIYAMAIYIGNDSPRLEYLQQALAITTHASAAPTVGSWAVGDRVMNSAPTVGQPKSWVCTVAGTPGTWVSEGNL